MRIALSIAAGAAIFLGLWLIASGFTESAPETAPSSLVVSAPPQTATPIVLGTALLAGGVIFLVLILRRR